MIIYIYIIIYRYIYNIIYIQHYILSDTNVRWCTGCRAAGEKPTAILHPPKIRTFMPTLARAPASKYLPGEKLLCHTMIDTAASHRGMFAVLSPKVLKCHVRSCWHFLNPSQPVSTLIVTACHHLWASSEDCHLSSSLAQRKFRWARSFRGHSLPLVLLVVSIKSLETQTAALVAFASGSKVQSQSHFVTN